jgi:acetoin utilization deacetylase AcuC-like enzyme
MNDLVIFYPEGHEAHAEINHPERPERVEVIWNSIKASGILNHSLQVQPEEIPNEILESIHSSKYLTYLESTSRNGGRLDMDTYITPASWHLALNAAGGAIAVSKSVWHRESRIGFALTRPPGHHATIDRGMGFCLLNNVAVATEYLLQVEGAQRVAIVDLDLHHGNGTQDIFWMSEDVLYISTHQYPHYPGTGRVTEIGSGQGEGKTLNFPMPPGSGDNAFLAAMEEAIIPMLHRYNPDIVLISYGFDTHWRDPLGSLLLSAQGYRALISRLKKFTDEECHGRIALFLEGGYDLEAAVACSDGVISGLLDQEWVDPIGPSQVPETSAYRPMLDQVRKLFNL